MNDEQMYYNMFGHENVEAYKKIRRVQQMIGHLLEDYISSKSSSGEDVKFVGRDKKRIDGADFIVNGDVWSIKNAWNTDNASSKKYRKDRNIKHWCRLNRNGSTNWDSLFIKGCSEKEFQEFISSKIKNIL
jgi:hypothetical protein